MPTQLERRIIEAELLHRLHDTLRTHMDEETALSLLEQTIAQAAREAGAAFAAQAPEGPSLKHFASIVDVWRNGGALDIKDSRLDGNELTLTVTRCAYMDSFRDMGLPPEIARCTSCQRDPFFAEGYSPNLRLERPEYIGKGDPACLFRFTWKD